MNNFFFKNLPADIVEEKEVPICNTVVCLEKKDFTRNFSKGKSFQFSTWNPIDTYNNDAFVQDWVVYNGLLWACQTLNINTPPGTDDSWIRVLDSKDISEFSWNEFYAE